MRHGSDPVIAELFSVIAPVLICAGIGFGWSKVGRPFDAELVTSLLTTIGAPCLVFHTLSNLQVTVAAFGTMVGASVVAFVVSLAVAAAGLRLAGWSLRAFVPTLVWPNTGNMGLPLCYLAFGDVGLGLAIAVFTVFSVTQFTIGAAIASGRLSLRELARVPVLYAVVLALVFMLTDLTPPRWINATTDLLGDITIPLMLITLGISLARLTVSNMPRSAAIAVARMALGLALGFGIAAALGLEGEARGVFILEMAMPVAVFNFLFAHRYQTSPEEVAGTVVVSTVLTFLALPLLLWYVM